MKSKFAEGVPVRFGDGLDVTPANLEDLLRGSAGRQPVLVLSLTNEADEALQIACQIKGIAIEYMNLIR